MLLDFRYMLHLEKILNNKSEDKPRFNFDNKKTPQVVLDLLHARIVSFTNLRFYQTRYSRYPNFVTLNTCANPLEPKTKLRLVVLIQSNKKAHFSVSL